MELPNIQLIASRVKLRRYWVLLPLFGLICVVFFTDHYASSANAADSMMATIRASTIFGLFMVALVIHMRIVHRSLITPLASHLWRYRWLYTIVPTFAFGALMIFSSDGGLPLSQVEARWLIGRVAAVFLIFLAFALHISVLHAIAMKKWLWLVALLIIWPLALVFFFYGTRYRSEE